MADVTLNEAIPPVRSLAQRKANAFVRRWHFSIDEREDVQSQLLISFLSGWPQFDGKRASVRTFAARVMDRELVSILRYRFAQGRQPRERPMAYPGPAAALIHQFRVDLERALASLPEVVRETASALSWLSAVETAEVVGCSRQMIGRRKHQIREALLAAGIRSNYFVGAGVQQ